MTAIRSRVGGDDLVIALALALFVAISFFAPSPSEELRLALRITSLVTLFAFVATLRLVRMRQLPHGLPTVPRVTFQVLWVLNLGIAGWWIFWLLHVDPRLIGAWGIQ